MATHSSIPSWKIPWTEEPGGLQSMDGKESDTAEHSHIHTYEKTQRNILSNPTPQHPANSEVSELQIVPHLCCIRHVPKEATNTSALGRSQKFLQASLVC